VKSRKKGFSHLKRQKGGKKKSSLPGGGKGDSPGKGGKEKRNKKKASRKRGGEDFPCRQGKRKSSASPFSQTRNAWVLRLMTEEKKEKSKFKRKEKGFPSVKRGKGGKRTLIHLSKGKTINVVDSSRRKKKEKKKRLGRKPKKLSLRKNGEKALPWLKGVQRYLGKRRGETRGGRIREKKKVSHAGKKRGQVFFFFRPIGFPRKKGGGTKKKLLASGEKGKNSAPNFFGTTRKHRPFPRFQKGGNDDGKKKKKIFPNPGERKRFRQSIQRQKDTAATKKEGEKREKQGEEKKKRSFRRKKRNQTATGEKVTPGYPWGTETGKKDKKVVKKKKKTPHRHLKIPPLR